MKTLDTIGLLWLALSCACLTGAWLVEGHMIMGVLMGLFLGSLLASVTLFGCARSTAAASLGSALCAAPIRAAE